MFKYISAIIKWIFRKETLENAIFAVHIARNLYTNKEAPDLEKNKSILRRLDIAQNGLDALQKQLPNKATDEWVKGINKSKDAKTWGDFTATLSKDKHGKGNNGIDLSLKTKILGIDLDLGYDPTDGSAGLKIGPFGFNFYEEAKS